MAYPIEENLLLVGRNTNRPGTPITVRGIISHRTGNPSPTADALAHRQYFGSAYRGASAHYFVDSGRILRIIPETEIAWHAGLVTSKTWDKGNPNAWAIGIELCENYPMGTPEMGRAYARYVWLHADICRRHDLDPRRDIFGHFEVDPRNRPSDPIGLFKWEPFIEDVVQTLAPAQGTPILGVPQVTAAQGRAYLARVAPGWEDIADYAWELGPVYGVRPEVAVALMLHETGKFQFGGLVKVQQNNFGGLGATGPGNPGHWFADRRQGVEAVLQHLHAYAATNPCPRTIIDPRYGLVARGSALQLEQLGGKWAHPGYNRAKYAAWNAAYAAGQTYGQVIRDRYLVPLLAMEEPEPEPTIDWQARAVMAEENLANLKGRIKDLAASL